MNYAPNRGGPARTTSGDIRGIDIASYLPALLHDLGVISCTLLEFGVQRPVESPDCVRPELHALARDARASVGPGESFHERLLDLGYEQGMFEDVLEPAMAHQHLDTAVARIELPVEKLSFSALEDVFSAADPSNMILLLSAIETAGGRRHLPMLDFRIKASQAHDAMALTIARKLGRGVLVVSGSSYHYYGHKLLTGAELSSWLLQAQLLGRFVDTRWITHQLLEGCCALRISAGHGYKCPPKVLQMID